LFYFKRFALGKQGIGKALHGGVDVPLQNAEVDLWFVNPGQIGRVTTDDGSRFGCGKSDWG